MRPAHFNVVVNNFDRFRIALKNSSNKNPERIINPALTFPENASRPRNVEEVIDFDSMILDTQKRVWGSLKTGFEKIWISCITKS